MPAVYWLQASPVQRTSSAHEFVTLTRRHVEGTEMCCASCAVNNECDVREGTHCLYVCGVGQYVPCEDAIHNGRQVRAQHVRPRCRAAETDEAYASA